MKKVRIILGIICGIVLIVTGVYYTQVNKNIDEEGPILSMDTDEITVSIEATEEELIQGVTAIDDKDGDVSDSIVIESKKKKINGKSNEFEISYLAFDSSNNYGRLVTNLIYEDYRKPHFSISRELRFPANQELDLFQSIQADDCLDGDLSPFITLEGADEIAESPSKGLYNCTLYVTNSVGDTAELAIQIEVYEETFEEQNVRPVIALNQYLIYIKKGEKFKPVNYIDYVQDKETQIDPSMVEIDSEVNNEKEGIYSVTYSYTSETSDYSCTAKLIVVVE